MKLVNEINDGESYAIDKRLGKKRPNSGRSARSSFSETTGSID